MCTIQVRFLLSLFPIVRIDTQPAPPRIFDRRHLPSKRAWKMFTLYTEDVDVVFMKKNSSLLTLERGRWIRMLCDNSNLHKPKLVKPKPLASKMAAVKKVGQKNGEVGLLVEYLFWSLFGELFPLVSIDFLIYCNRLQNTWALGVKILFLKLYICCVCCFLHPCVALNGPLIIFLFVSEHCLRSTQHLFQVQTLSLFKGTLHSKWKWGLN